MRQHQRLHHVALNVAKFVKLRRDPDLKEDVVRADLVSVDGMGILIGARLLGINVPERVAGVDLMERLIARCAQEGFRPYFVGAHASVLAEALQKLQTRYPTLS